MLRFVSDGAGEGVDGGRPTSRGLPLAVRWATLPCPLGKGRCWCAGSTLFALQAKALQSGAPDHGVSRERVGFSERFAHQGSLPARRGTGERAAPRRGCRLRAIPRTERALLPARAPNPSFLRPFRAICGPSHACLRPFCTFYGHPASTKVSFPPFPLPPHLPVHPAGRTAGSARTRPRDQSLGYPFLGSGCHLPRYPRPPKRRRRQAPARGLAAVCALSRPARNVKTRPCPLLVGHGRVDLEPKALADRTAVIRGSSLRRRNRPCDRLRGWRNADLLRTRSA